MRYVNSSAPSCSCVIPRGFVVGLRLGVKAGENAVRIARQLKAGFDDKRCVREVDQVFFRDAVVLDGIANDAAEKRDVRAGANLAEEISNRGRACKARVHGDYFCVARTLGFDGPLESAGMVLGGISPHDEPPVGILPFPTAP